ncbi:hypothetical protein B0H19DRAFT_1382647 [Mycena capillaripes]|nr:hypothetical protein B0H19DRAFT_1382647 [Mycena capillaripes]
MADYVSLPEFDEKTIYREHPSRGLRLVCFLSILINLAFLWPLTTYRHVNTAGNEPYLYSPAEHVVSHKVVKFTRGILEDIPIYEQPPSIAVDDAWAGLYSVAEAKIPKSEAMKMPNRTWPIARDPGNYMFTLDVFHQLHCLDTLRKQVHPAHNYTRMGLDHIRHCIGVIRQALMCSADISTVVWQWSEDRQRVEQRDDIVHVCRDFDRIRDWTSKRTFLPQRSDFDFYVEDDLDIKPF